MFVKKGEEKFFLNHLNQQQRVLEWGSGESTYQIARYVKEVISIEHQKEWYNKINRRRSPNVMIYLAEPDLPYVEGGDDGTYDEFKTYINLPIDKGCFDVILIDGRARVECAKICHKIGNENTLIFIHDFEREEYHVVLEFLEPVKSCNGMILLKLK